MSNRFHFILLILIDIILVYATVANSKISAALAFLLTIYVVLRGTSIQSFYTLLSTCFFSSVFEVGSIGVYFIIILLCCSKLSSQRKINTNIIFVGLILSLACIWHDFPYHTTGRIINDVVNLTCLFCLLSIRDWSDYNHVYSVSLFLVSIVIVQAGAILLTGDLTQLSDDSITNVRMAEGDTENGFNNTLDGAMGFPITTLLFSTLSLPLLFSPGTKSSLKFVTGIFSIGLLLVTFFTTSRVYLLGLCVFLPCICIELLKRKKHILIIILFSIALIVIFYMSPLVDIIFYRYSHRFDNGIGERELIFQSCFTYLKNNPLCILFGDGRAYPTIGGMQDLAFYKSAHNIILDGIMAYGLVGLCIIIFISISFIKSIYCTSANKLGFLGIIPFLCWFVMCQTNTAFYLPKTFVLIPFLLLHAKFYNTLITYEQ